MYLGISIGFVSCLLLVPSTVKAMQAGGQSPEKAASEFRARIEASPVLPFKGVAFAAQPLKPGWKA